MTKKISVIGCGVQRAGSTSFFAHLAEHPSLSAPSTKELHFFDDESRDWVEPHYHLDEYYPGDDSAKLRFEVTPIYAYWPPSSERIHNYNPDCRLIYIFRDPIERAWSQWRMQYYLKFENLDFSSSLRQERERISAIAPLAIQRRRFSYVD